MKMLYYRGYVGTAWYSTAKGMFCGRIVALAEPVLFEAIYLDQLREAFELAVDCYEEFCQAAGPGIAPADPPE